MISGFCFLVSSRKHSTLERQATLCLRQSLCGALWKSLWASGRECTGFCMHSWVIQLLPANPSCDFHSGLRELLTAGHATGEAMEDAAATRDLAGGPTPLCCPSSSEGLCPSQAFDVPSRKHLARSPSVALLRHQKPSTAELSNSIKLVHSILLGHAD